MQRNFMFWHVFRDCNFSCEFCRAVILKLRAKGGSESFSRFKDLKFHERMLRLFDEQLSRAGSWTICLTGGEPLMMPHLPFLSGELIRRGHRIRYNTNLSLPIERNDDFLKANPPEGVEVFMVSIHPESHQRLDEILERIRTLKGMGYRLIVRSVATSDSFPSLSMLDETCREMDVSFTPLSLQSNSKTATYTPEEFIRLRSLMKGFGELLILYGGMNPKGRICHAGHRSLVLSTLLEAPQAIVRPCAHCQQPRLATLDLASSSPLGEGLYDQLATQPQLCPCPTMKCQCPGIFEHDLVLGLEAGERYEAMCKGYTEPIWEEFESWVLQTGLKLHSPPETLRNIPTQLDSILPPKRRFSFLSKLIGRAGLNG